LQDRYRGPLVITERLPGDVYRVVELDSTKKSRFATTAHVTQLKSWRLGEEAEPEVELERQTEDGDTDSEDSNLLLYCVSRSLMNIWVPLKFE